MKKWKLFFCHLLTSLKGFLRFIFTHGGINFSFKLLSARIHFFLTRQLKKSLLTPNGFLIETTDALISYWAIFVEQELYSTQWTYSLQHSQTPLVLDVGANAGIFSHYVHQLNPSTEVIAFEPLPEMAKRVEALKQRTGLNITCNNQAASNKIGKALLETNSGTEGVSKLCSVPNALTQTIEVNTVTLDSITSNRKVKLIKIDVEDHELEVLQGATSTLKNTDFLIIEARSIENLNQISAILGDQWEKYTLKGDNYLFKHKN